uniref:Uncharacterized protein n=1 Tax=Trypanosoma congolense (strain IL3000) TaxID=1068625 RepID=G0UWR1_TRYCI|nr:conserved hypothetical protein [Trypanosoma congolense IL3000]
MKGLHILFIGVGVGVVVVCIVIGCIICIYCRGRNEVPSTGDLAQEGRRLYYIDFAGNGRVLDVGTMGIIDGDALLSSVAMHCGLRDPSAITLMYVNEAGRNVEVDPDLLLLQDDELPRRLMQTKTNPLRLGWHLNALEKKRRRSRQQKIVDVIDTGEMSQMYSPNGSVRYADGSPSSGAMFGRAETESQAACDSFVDEVPVPIILPAASNITTDTPVTITATRFIVESTNDVVDTNIAIAVREALSKRMHRSIPLDCGSTIVVDPSRFSVFLKTPRGTNHVVREYPASNLHYTIDNSGASQWYPYRNPIFLPPGRWCVRAEASSVDHLFIETSSRVFTVNVAGANR